MTMRNPDETTLGTGGKKREYDVSRISWRIEAATANVCSVLLRVADALKAQSQKSLGRLPRLFAP